MPERNLIHNFIRAEDGGTDRRADDQLSDRSDDVSDSADEMRNQIASKLAISASPNQSDASAQTDVIYRSCTASTTFEARHGTWLSIGTWDCLGGGGNASSYRRQAPGRVVSLSGGYGDSIPQVSFILAGVLMMNKPKSLQGQTSHGREAAASFTGDDICLIEALDACDGNGFHRKCRVMIIDRKIYPIHLAISRRWKVHYFKADMANSPENRAQDAAFFDDATGFVGARGMAALERIGAALDLDHCGIDFAVNAASDTLLFEANATVVLVVPLSADRKWDYRRPAFDKVFAAVHSMLVERRRARRLGRWRRSPSGPARKSPPQKHCTEYYWPAYFLIGLLKERTQIPSSFFLLYSNFK